MKENGMQPRKLARILSASLGGTLAAASVHAGVVSLDFNTDPSTSGKITALVSSDATPWRQDGGATGAAGDGYVVISDARGSQSTHIVFEDLEPGFIIASFTFECDLRLGGGRNAPADGFSLNFASAEDPVVTSAENGETPAGYNGTDDETNLPEEGTSTGLAIGFDTWQSATIGGVQDVVGISVRVNGALLTQFPVPLMAGNQYPGGTYDAAPYANLPKTDPNYPKSMQTGPQNKAAIVAAGYTDDTEGGALNPQPEFGDPDWGLWVANLGWEHFKATVTPDGKVQVFWKGVELTPAGGIQTTFSPIPGRVVFAGRTGGNWQAQHVDNLTITTTPANVGLVGAIAGDPFGFDVTLTDSGDSIVDGNSIGFTLDGTAVTPTSVTADAGVTTAKYRATQPLVSGSEHTLVVTGKDKAGKDLLGAGDERTFTVPTFVTVPPANAVTGVSTTDRGFRVRTYQLDGNGNGTTISGGEHMFHGDFGPNVADLSLFQNGVYSETGVINYEQAAADAGAFNASATNPDMAVADGLFPGIPGAVTDTANELNNFGLEFVTYLNLDVAGVYTFYFNSDDGFRITSAPNPLEQINNTILDQADGGKGASDVTSLVYIAQPGYYPVRILYYEGGGGASAEFSITKPGGTRQLVNSDAADAVKAYRTRTGDTPSAVSFSSRTPNSGPSFGPLTPLEFDIEDGSTPVDQATVKVSVNGADVAATVTKTGTTTKAIYTPTLANPWASGTTLDTKVTFGTYTGTNAVPIAAWTAIPASLATAPGTGATPGMKWRTYQTANGNGTTIAGAENELAGGNGADIHDTSGQGADGFFDIDFVNFDQAAAAAGNFTVSAAGSQAVQDELIPGIPGTTASTDNIAGEAKTYLDLQTGAYQMVVNSDDGFEVTAGINSTNVADMKFVSLGKFDAGRGSADTAFYFKIDQAGVYFFRLLWFEGGGGANVEWFTVNADGSRALVNGTQTGAIKGYRTRTVAEPTLPTAGPELSISLAAGNITIAWQGAGTLQETTDLKTWTNVAASANPFTTAADQTAKFYRVSQ